MTEADHAICFQCGQDAAQTRRLNRLEDGRACTVCAERLLLMLPPVLPGRAAQEPALESELGAELEREFDSDSVEGDFDRPA